MTPVVIVGGGPAGCAAAITLRQAGLPVVLLEVERFPRYRPGETLHPGVEPILESLGVATQVNDAGFVRHEGHEVWSAKGRETFHAFGSDSDGEWLGYQAWRPEFDQILLIEARNLGTDILQPRRAGKLLLSGKDIFGITTQAGNVPASFVLDASGRNHWLSRKLDIGWKACSHSLTARYGYANWFKDSLSHPRIELDDTGWTWLAPIGSNRFSWVRLNLDGSDPGANWIPPALAGTARQRRSRGANVTWRIAKETAGQNWYLLGDAAAVLDPASSHGVLRALMSGIQAANLIVKVCSDEVRAQLATSYYCEWMKQWFYADVEQLQLSYAWRTWDPALAPVTLE